jgi:hypothetical protein
MAQAWYTKNRDIYLARCRDKYKQDPEKLHSIKRDSRIRRKYGLEPGKYDEMLVSQGMSCKICGSKYPGRDRVRFSVDHDHETGKVRGLLCYPCNTILGMSHDSIITLTAALDYLKEYK